MAHWRLSIMFRVSCEYDNERPLAMTNILSTYHIEASRLGAFVSGFSIEAKIKPAEICSRGTDAGPIFEGHDLYAKTDSHTLISCLSECPIKQPPRPPPGLYPHIHTMTNASLVSLRAAFSLADELPYCDGSLGSALENEPSFAKLFYRVGKQAA